MSFIASGTGSTDIELIENSSFFPDLKLSEFRDEMRVDNVVSAPRAAHALRAAVMGVNRQLLEFMLSSQEIGLSGIEEVAPSPGQPPDQKTLLYLRAVYCLAKADLMERYRDYDATNAGNKKAENLNDNIDEMRRNAAWAITDIIGKRRLTVDLI